ncbi:glycosyltransferase family 4 protein [Henriciella sp.]|uniref:glycosyltransferase family 4 protein n=1 Tax=Henriciella sp. TaxID=1968823 RepID=UPI0017E9B8DF|nr:glycosyltransferase family 4 protein [Henriciella sp.]HIG21941.1 glycosyltransferase [Henriciella sp.]
MRGDTTSLQSIALLTPGIPPYVTGGMQRHSFNLAKHLAQLGVKVDLYHIMNSGDQTLDDLIGMTAKERRNITNLAIPWHAGRWPGHYIRSLKRFSRAAYDLYQTRPPVDFILAKSLTGWSFVAAKQQGAILPLIAVNFHGYEMFQPRPTLYTMIEAAMLRPAFQSHANSADYVVSYGGRVTDILSERMGIDQSRIIEIPGGTDPALYAAAPTPTLGKRKFVFLGRYERRKGIEELNASILRNPNWSERCEFRFIGAIPSHRRLNLPHVSYTGELRDPDKIQAYLKEADVLLCPSHAEGMPNVIMEGMAAGLAIMATDVGAVRLLVSEDNGIVLPLSSCEAISIAVENFLTMPDEALDHLKRTSHDRIRGFFWPAIAELTRATLSNLLTS